MEVTCLDVSNPPAKPVLAIHAGSVRRQAKLEVNSPFVIPHPGSQSGPVEVSLFQQLASQVLPDDGKAEVFCNIPVRTLDGAASQVQLRIRRGDAALTNDGPKGGTNDSIGLTRDYLDHHQLQQRIQSLIQDVLREQPENPYKYMLEQLRKAQAEKSKKDEPTPAAEQASAEAPKQPMAPRPPAQPKPEKTGRNLHSQTKPASDSKAVEVAVPNGVKPPQSQAHAAARYSISLVLRGKSCLAAAEESLRQSARREAAKSMTALVMGAVTQKLIQSTQIETRELARMSVSLSMRGAAVLLTPEYHRALTRWAVHVALRGATDILGLKEDKSRRESIPTPIVFLQSERQGWGDWLK
mmetsp:Transcript_49905/g.93543  ORF Transcript_49905/g.93543 Transcript_49905/m.93543 type:complete len:354 (-) Transcript_49905:295-1356(-)